MKVLVLVEYDKKYPLSRMLKDAIRVISNIIDCKPKGKIGDSLKIRIFN